MRNTQVQKMVYGVAGDTNFLTLTLERDRRVSVKGCTLRYYGGERGPNGRCGVPVNKGDNVEMPARRDNRCDGQHDNGAMLATRTGRGCAWGEFSTPATFLVRACRKCGARVEEQ